MSKIIAGAAIRGGHAIVQQAEEFFEKAREEKGEDTPIGFPDTAYYLPMIHALLGLEIETLGELKPVLAHARELIGDEPADALWFPYLGTALDAGIATLLSAEIIMVLPFTLQDSAWESFSWMNSKGTPYQVYTDVYDYRCGLGIGGDC